MRFLSQVLFPPPPLMSHSDTPYEPCWKSCLSPSLGERENSNFEFSVKFDTILNEVGGWTPLEHDSSERKNHVWASVFSLPSPITTIWLSFQDPKTNRPDFSLSWLSLSLSILSLTHLFYSSSAFVFFLFSSSPFFIFSFTTFRVHLYPHHFVQSGC